MTKNPLHEMHRDGAAPNIKKIVSFYQRKQCHIFFYVNDIVIASRSDQRNNVNFYVKCLMKTFEIRDMSAMKFFLEVRIIRKKRIVSMIQNTYMKKLIRKYDIDPVNIKAPVTSIPVDLKAFDDEADIADTHQYRKMVGSMCYSVVCTRPNIAKTAFKLSEFFTNLGPNHIKAVIQCLCYLYVTKSLGIQYSAKTSCEEYLMAEAHVSTNQVFEATADVSFANYPDRKSDEGYTFRLFGDLID